MLKNDAIEEGNMCMMACRSHRRVFVFCHRHLSFLMFVMLLYRFCYVVVYVEEEGSGPDGELSEMQRKRAEYRIVQR